MRSNHLFKWLLISCTAIPVGLAYSAAIGGALHIGASIAFFIAASITGLEMFFVQRRPGEILRRSPLPIYIGITTLFWLIIITIGLQLVPTLFLGTAYLSAYESDHFIRDTLFAFAISLVNNSIYRVRSLVGPGVFMRFLLGRYHRPKRENRVFMFLDMANSTELSEKLGDLKVQALISRFFFDLAQPIAQYKGETHRYIGDEVVVTWSIASATRAAACVRCVAAIEQHMRSRRHWYIKKFGTVPEYRIGMHGGPVVASEVGDSKREIVYFGDTINTAARLCSACKSVERKVLVSQKLLDEISLPSDISATRIDNLQLAGKSKPIAVAALEWIPS